MCSRFFLKSHYVSDGVSQVPSVLFAPSHLMAVMTLGINSALVMDCGYTETLVLPVSFSCHIVMKTSWINLSHITLPHRQEEVAPLILQLLTCQFGICMFDPLTPKPGL